MFIYYHTGGLLPRIILKNEMLKQIMLKTFTRLKNFLKFIMNPRKKTLN